MTTNSFLVDFIETAERACSVKEAAELRLIEHSDEACGMFHIVIDPASGQANRRIFRCKNYRECENCARVRELEIGTLISEFAIAKMSTQLYSKELTQQEYRVLSRRLGNDNLLRLPQYGDVCIMLFADKEFADPGDVVYQIEDFKDQELLHDLATTPARKRITGWRPPVLDDEDKDKDDTELVVYQRGFLVHNPNEAKDMAFEAISRTRDVARKVAELKDEGDLWSDDLQWALNQRENAFMEIANERGVSVAAHKYMVKKVVYLSDVRWNQGVYVNETEDKFIT